MPRTPPFAPAAMGMPGAVFSPIADRMQQVPGGVCPLHVGDTWMPPFDGGRMEDLREDEHPGMHRYCETRGLSNLIDAVVERHRRRPGLTCERENVLVTGGATGGLGTALGAVASPGDEVLILAPFWPLIRGIVQTFRATPVEVPFFGEVDSVADAIAVLDRFASDRTVAVYVSTPSNPTGRILPGEWLEAMAAWAQRRGLWILSDEVYEEYVYRGEHVSMARFAPERTISVYSFSKAYGMAGNRTGYLVAPAEAVAQCQKIGTHTFYHAPTAGPARGDPRARVGGGVGERCPREVPRHRGRNRADARCPFARGLSVPLRRCALGAGRTRHLGVSLGLCRRRCRDDTRAQLRHGLRAVRTCLLYRGTPG